MADERLALAVDAGGTFLKGAVLDSSGLARSDPFRVSVDSSGPRERILGSYADIVSRGLASAAAQGARIAGIGVATPGPFDYTGGRSLMQHKFRSIYGVDLRRELRARCVLRETLPIRFLHDVHAFVSGEMLRGAARGYSNVAGITIGTGVGFGCVVDGRFLDSGSGGPHVSLYRQAHGEGIVEDVVSRRGIISGYRARSGREGELDVVDIAALARDSGDPHAQETFRHTARVLAESVAGFLREAGVQCLVVGGQIAKAYDLMAPELESLLGGVPTLRSVGPAANIDLAALYGAAGLALGP